MSDIQALLQQYFQSKRKQLLAASEQVITPHSGLKGAHREEVIRIFLNGILPKRFEVGCGIIYGKSNRSKETDIVIWDAINFPKLEMLGHDFFFATSVKAAIEVKTQWSQDIYDDIKEKCSYIKRLDIPEGSPNLQESIQILEQRLNKMNSGHGGEITALIAPPTIGTAAVIFRGGQSFEFPNDRKELGRIEDSYPDLLVLIDEGIIFSKHVEFEENTWNGIGTAQIINAGEDVLLFFAIGLLEMLMERVVHSESHFYMKQYVGDLFDKLASENRIRHIAYPITRPPRINFF
jgi:hypothetical protein